jgi:ABC-2 type transport system ATP-binding protein
MWEVVRRLRDSGVTIILTTHYIEEAEEMADRVGVINKGKLVLVEDKAALMKKLGKKEMTLQLQKPLERVPESLADFSLQLSGDGGELTYVYDSQSERTGITRLFKALEAEDIRFSDLQTNQSSLEEIFVNLVSRRQ